MKLERSLERKGTGLNKLVDARIRDVRRSSIRFRGYSISQRPSSGGRSWHVHVRIDKEAYREVKAHLVALATRRTVERLHSELRWVRFEPYFPVKKQLRNVLREMNRQRKGRGFKPVPQSALRSRINIVKPFGEAQ